MCVRACVSVNTTTESEPYKMSVSGVMKNMRSALKRITFNRYDVLPAACWSIQPAKLIRSPICASLAGVAHQPPHHPEKKTTTEPLSPLTYTNANTHSRVAHWHFWRFFCCVCVYKYEYGRRRAGRVRLKLSRHFTVIPEHTPDGEQVMRAHTNSYALHA